MNPSLPMQEPVSSTPGYYTYQPASGPLIRLSLDALEGMLSEVMTGFGAIPRRGAEVGGVLLGRVEGSEIWIESFAMVACEYRRGPSYLLSEQDRTTFAETFQSHTGAQAVPVGLFRSNTRDQNTVTDEDRELFGGYFPPPQGTFLMVRPFAAKTSAATFLVYKDGVLPDSNPDVFPFQRRELEGGAAPRRRPLNDGHPHHQERSEAPVPPSRYAAPDDAPLSIAPVRSTPELGEVASNAPGFDPDGFARAQPPATSETRERRRGWHWIPLSFLFLLLGVLLGFQSALTFYPRPPAIDASMFELGLNVTAKDDNLHIKWNRESPAIRLAQRGRLEIQDGKYNKTVDLDASSLQTGSVVYPPVSGNVTLRLRVIFKGATSALDTVDWSRKP